MIYQPEKGQMWDPSVLWHEGTWYAIMMHNPDGHFMQSPHGLMATSSDGVHWQDAFVAVNERERSEKDVFCKAFIGRVNGGFFLNHGLARDGINDMLRFYRSDDMRHWTWIADSTPDPRYYNTAGDVRWDHMYILPKDEENPGAGYWGYATACPKDGCTKGFGMMESDDGFVWRALPAPDIEWGDIPPANFEVGGCERIGDRYYLIAGWWRWVCEGYAMYTFVADEPCGPFRPDREAFRLCGSSTIPKNILACFARGADGELLVCEYMNSPTGVWMLPLRKPSVADGHLRLCWWNGNEALRGDAISLAPNSQSFTLDAPQGAGEVRWLDFDLDTRRGFVLEGELRVTPTGPCAFAGFALQEEPGIRRELRMEIGRTNEAVTRTGRHTEIFGFQPEDVAGPACATLTALPPDRTVTCRLLVRRGMFELYIDDHLVRTSDWRPKPGGERLGLLAGNAHAIVEQLACHAMTLEGADVSHRESQGLNPI